MGMWSLCSINAHRHRRKHHLIRNPSQQGATAQGDFDFSEKKGTAENKREFTEISKSHKRVDPSKEHRSSFGLSSHRLRITYISLVHEFSQPPSKFFARRKIQPNPSGLSQATGIRNSCISDPQSLSNSAHVRLPTPRVYRRSAHEITTCKPHKRKYKEHTRGIKDRVMTYCTIKRDMAAPNEFSAPMRKRLHVSTGAKKHNRYLSEPSLPLNSSPTSSFTTSPAEYANSYILSTLDALSARPTIKCASKPRYIPHTAALTSNQIDQRRSRIFNCDSLQAHERVNGLADHMSANELRDVLERDRKRKEKMMIAQQIRMESRLARIKEKQHAKQTADTHEKQSFESYEEFKNSANIFSDLEANSSLISKKRKQKAEAFSRDATSSVNRSFSPSPIYDHRFDSIDQADMMASSSKNEDQAYSKVQNPIPKKNRVGMFPLRISTHSNPAMLPKESTDNINASSTKLANAWTSFFKMGSKNERPNTEISFLSSSRDSPSSVHELPSCYTTFQSTSISFPKNTFSRFREDLPDFPSPTSSKYFHGDNGSQAVSPKVKSDGDLDNSTKVYCVKSSSHQEPIVTTSQQSVTSLYNYLSTNKVPPDFDPLSQYLGTIDSEALWLSSGRDENGISFMYHNLPNKKSISISPQNSDLLEPTNEYVDEFNEDDYFGHLSQIDQEQGSSFFWDDDTTEASIEPTKWGAVDRRPHMVYRSPLERKSREGLLNDYQAESDNLSPREPAMSVELHRQISHDTLRSRPRSRAATLSCDQNYPRERSNRIILNQNRLSCR